MGKLFVIFFLFSTFVLCLSDSHNISKRSVYDIIENTVSVVGNTLSEVIENSTKDVVSSLKDVIEDTVSNINSTATSAIVIRNTLKDIIATLGDIPNLTNGLNITDIGSYILNSITNEEAKADASELVQKSNYSYENHTVTTEDGYQLSVGRIPGKGKRVFLMHGLLSSSDDFVTTGNDSGLAYLLAAKGYDVWMGNARGNKHSRAHISLSVNSPEFWNFSWHEIGIYDLPAMIDYILKITNQTQLIYIGHSQGTTSFFVMGSERPEYNKKVSLMISLSTVAWMSHIKSVIFRALVPLSDNLTTLLYLFGQYEIAPNNLLIELFKDALCTVPFPLCNNIIFLIFGFSYDQFNIEDFPVIISHTPAGAATKQLLHYLQEIKSGEFCNYDYGSEKNMEIYGSADPPSYAVENITAPIYIFHSPNDWLSNITDVQVLRDRIPNEVGFYDVPHDTFNHLDYLFATDVVKLLYKQVLNVIDTSFSVDSNN